MVYVLVINWNGVEHLAECFDTLLESSYRDVRFVLIDNASTDGSVAFFRERYGGDPRVAVIECPSNLGWSGGNNAGLEAALEAGADYAFLLNNDTATAPDAIERLVRAAEAQPNVGALAPKMLLYSNPALLNSVGITCSIIGSSWDIGIGRLDGPHWDKPEPVIGVCGGACFLRLAALRRTGLLPAEFGIYLDDLDICLRIWNAGYEVRRCPEAVVRHKFGATMDQGAASFRKYYLNTRNRFYILLRNFPLSRIATVAAAVAVGECRAIGRAAFDGQFWRISAHVRAWLAAMAYVPRAWSERSRRRSGGMASCRFWPLVRKDCLFFAGTEFPQDGWYAERRIAGKLFRPMSSRAHIEASGGKLRLAALNCYPELGRMIIDISMNGQPVVTLDSAGLAEQTVETLPGRLEFAARHLFSAGDTGERYDIGGWLSVTPA